MLNAIVYLGGNALSKSLGWPCAASRSQIFRGFINTFSLHAIVFHGSALTAFAWLHARNMFPFHTWWVGLCAGSGALWLPPCLCSTEGCSALAASWDPESTWACELVGRVAATLLSSSGAAVPATSSPACAVTALRPTAAPTCAVSPVSDYL